MLTVIAVISVLSVVALYALKGSRVAGARRGAADVVMQSVEQARMTAIEKGVQTYVGFADESYSDPDGQLRAYIIFRDYTQEEVDAITAGGGTVDSAAKIAETKWQYLPKGFYFDAVAGSLFSDDTAKMDVLNLPPVIGTKLTLHVVAFDSLGQVTTPQSGSPQIILAEGRYDQKSNTLIKTAENPISAFTVQVSRLTGRVQFKDATTTSSGTN